MSYQQRKPTFERFILDPTNETWLDDLTAWVQSFAPTAELREDPDRGGAERGGYMIRVVKEMDDYYYFNAWGEDPWVMLYNNLDGTFTEVTQAQFNTYYEAS